MRYCLLAALSIACGCASGLEANRRSPGALGNGAFTPGRPSAAQYGQDPGRPCESSGSLQVLANELEDQARSRNGAAPRPDGRLCAIAETLLGWDEKAEPPSESILAFLSWHFGLPAPVQRVTVAVVDTEDAKEIAGRLLEPIATFARAAAEPRFGVATLRLRKNVTRLALLLQDAPVDLEPIPRRLALNGQAVVSGQLRGRLDKARIFICDSSGRLETPPAAPARAFRVELRCGERPGRAQVEIRAEEKGAGTVAARFPVYCGMDPPASVPIPARDQRPDPAGEEKKLFALVNAERASSGLAPLTWDDAVGRAARRISEQERDQAATNAPTKPDDVVARLKQADVISPVVLQNPARAPSVVEAHARFDASPVHRCNFLSSEATHAGMGVALAAEPDGRSSAIVTELFVRELPEVDVGALRAKLRAAVARKRADARAPGLVADDILERVAEQYAHELAKARGTLDSERSNEIVRPLYKTFRVVHVLSGVKSDPLEMAEEPGLLAAGKALGVGVAQGAHAALGKNAVYVVVLIGTRR